MKRYAAAAVAAAAALYLALALAGCGGSGAKVGDSSPRADAAGASITASSDMTEAGQLVQLSIPFSAPVQIDGDAAADLQVTLDGSALDEKTVALELSAQGSELLLSITPAETAGGLSSGSYFALYQAQVSVAAANADGSLPHVVGEDGSAAVLAQPVEGLVPSGMQIEELESVPGSVSVRVTQTAQLRCCTWFELGGEEFYMHHHTFYQETPASCAAALAAQVNVSLAGSYEASAKGPRVTITAAGDGDGSALSMRILEGVGA